MLKTKKDILQLQHDLHDIRTYLDTHTEDYFNHNIQKHWEILKAFKL